MDHHGKRENREQARGVPYDERVKRWGHWSCNYDGTGSRSRGAHPDTISEGGRNTVRREWVDQPYNANARSNYGRSSGSHWGAGSSYRDRDDWGESASSWQPYHRDEWRR